MIATDLHLESAAGPGRDVGVLVAAHEEASRRRAAGRPSWDRTIRVGHLRDEALTFEERRDGMVTALRASSWPAVKDRDDAVWMYVDELADVTKPEDYDLVMANIYDAADIERVLFDRIR